MAVDQSGRTIATGETFLLAGIVRRIEGATVLCVAGAGGARTAVRLNSTELLRVDDLVHVNGSRWFTGPQGTTHWPTADAHLVSKLFLDVQLAGLIATAASIFQPLDGTLSALAGLTTAADRVPYFTGTDVAAVATLTSFGRSLIDDANATAAQTTLGLVPGSTVQAFSGRLDDLDANVISAGNPGIYGTDGGGTSSLINSAGAADDDLLVVNSAAAGYHEWKPMASLLETLRVPRCTWSEIGDPVRTVGASSTTEQTLVSATIGGVASSQESYELRFWGDFIQNSGGSNTSRLRVKLGATTVYDKANAFGTSSGRRVLVGRITVAQRGSTSLQRITGEVFLSQPHNATSGFGDYGAFAFHGGVVAGDASETLTAAKTLTLTHQWDVSNANSYLRIYRAELIRTP